SQPPGHQLTCRTENRRAGSSSQGSGSWLFAAGEGVEVPTGAAGVSASGAPAKVQAASSTAAPTARAAAGHRVRQEITLSMEVPPLLRFSSFTQYNRPGCLCEPL